ncbi:hypothetical protein BKA65DRAFT_486171 [Rhexocercosporidium sp. MPI-PUGE-AT-0058]|nr:hypothetical protein BKA65DRAFT_486171 [Rhexocercosporidium sp. MPI-PUGE-AT-0058]
MEYTKDRCCEEAREPMDLLPTPQNTQAISATGTSLPIPPPQPRAAATLVTLPPEILTEILRRVCKHDEPLKPEQWLPRSTKFAHDTPFNTSNFGRYRHPVRVNGRLDPALAAVDLANTCRAISRILGEDCPMYKYNSFEFRDMKAMLTYLVAITPERRNAIKSIRVLYDYGSEPTPALIILSTCKALERLELDITIMSKFFDTGVFSFSEAPGYAELMKLRGVDIKLVYSEEGTHWNLIHDVLVTVRHSLLPLDPRDVEDLRAEVHLLNETINAVTKVARPPIPIYTANELQAAADTAGIPGLVFNAPPSTLIAPAQQNHDIAGPSGNELSPQPFEIPTEAQNWYAADNDPADWE